MNGLKLKSKICLTEFNCYPIESELPAWFILLLAGASAFLIKEIYQSLT